MRIMIRVFQFFFSLLLLCFLYFGSAQLFTLFPQDKTCTEGKHKLYIYKNKELLSHTEIIMKVAPFKEDYFKAFPKLLHNNPNGYIAFSYGDRDFMMDKKGFDDLNTTLAFRGLFVNTPSLIKVGHYGNFKKSNATVLMLSTKCLSNLKDTILASFEKDAEDKVIRFNDVYKRYYVHYFQAKDAYNLFHTCNTWTGDRLREAGFKMGYWTPLAQNVTSQFN